MSDTPSCQFRDDRTTGEAVFTEIYNWRSQKAPFQCDCDSRNVLAILFLEALHLAIDRHCFLVPPV